jgi:hypothetical protein
VASTAAFFMLHDNGSLHGSKYGSNNIKSEHTHINAYIHKMDNNAFRRRYRMSKEAFWSLLETLEDRMGKTEKKRKCVATPNGKIIKVARLSMAIRYFSGGIHWI